MLCGAWTTTDVPDSEVDGVVDGYKLDGASDVQKTRQPNGKWAVTARFPPCPPGYPQSQSKVHRT